MTTRLKIAWILSILATALASFGFVGSGTSASFSDTVTVTHKIQTGRLKLSLVKVDGQALEPPVQDYRLSDQIKGANSDLTRELELRNEGTVDIASIFLGATPTEGDSVALAEALTVTVGLIDQDGATETARSLASWESGPRKLQLPSILAPGESVTVTMHTTGKVELDAKDAKVEPVYTFTGYANQ